MGKDLPKKEFFSYVGKLKESHYPYAPQWLKTKSGKFLVSWHGRPYYMTEWVTGRGLNREPEDYVSLGKALGHLHKLRRIHRTPTPLYTQQRIKTFKAQSHLFQQHLNYIRNKNNESSRWLEKHGEHCVQLSNEAWGIFQDPKVRRLLAREKRHPTLVHGDVTIPNIVIHHRGLVLIDWDCLRTESMYYEVAKTLANTTAFKPTLIDGFLQGYESIRPLKSSERLLISALFRFPREAWNVARKTATGRSYHELDILDQTWSDRLNAINHLDKWAKR